MNKKRTCEKDHAIYNDKFKEKHMQRKKRLEIEILKNNKR